MISYHGTGGRPATGWCADLDADDIKQIRALIGELIAALAVSVPAQEQEEEQADFGGSQSSPSAGERT